MANADLKQLRERAWIGDSVLELYVRQWVLRQGGGINAELKMRFTNNAFLNCLGNPTAVEAQVGDVFLAQGLEAAQAWIREHIEPLFLKQEAKRGRHRTS